MKLAIMQPYFFPYIGYFQLMNAVDEFIIYDNIQYTKKGWINRNRILNNGDDLLISLPLKKDSDYLDIRERMLADTWKQERIKLLNRIIESYRKAPYFQDVYPVIEICMRYDTKNLFDFILNSISCTKNYLEIKTSIKISSSVEIDHTLKSEQKILALCSARKADNYINPIGGVSLYDKQTFREIGVELQFLKSCDINYRQFGNEFKPWLSIIDVMMFNSKQAVARYLDSCFTLN